MLYDQIRFFRKYKFFFIIIIQCYNYLYISLQFNFKVFLT